MPIQMPNQAQIPADAEEDNFASIFSSLMLLIYCVDSDFADNQFVYSTNVLKFLVLATTLAILIKGKKCFVKLHQAGETYNQLQLTLATNAPRMPADPSLNVVIPRVAQINSVIFKLYHPAMHTLLFFYGMRLSENHFRKAFEKLTWLSLLDFVYTLAEMLSHFLYLKIYCPEREFIFTKAFTSAIIGIPLIIKGTDLLRDAKKVDFNLSLTEQLRIYIYDFLGMQLSFQLPFFLLNERVIQQIVKRHTYPTATAVDVSLKNSLGNFIKAQLSKCAVVGFGYCAVVEKPTSSFSAVLLMIGSTIAAQNAVVLFRENQEKKNCKLIEFLHAVPRNQGPAPVAQQMQMAP